MNTVNLKEEIFKHIDKDLFYAIVYENYKETTKIRKNTEHVPSSAFGKPKLNETEQNE